MKRTLLIAVLVPLMVGCTLFIPRIKPDDPTPEPRPSPSPLVVEFGDGVQLALIGEDWPWQTSGDRSCADTVHRLTTPTGDYQVSLLRKDCTGDPEALNGFHGAFTSPPAGGEVATANTPLGPALLFTHQYEECTNSCGFGNDEVALVAVGGRTLQAIALTQVGGSGAHAGDRAQLVALLQGLSKA